MTEVGQGLDFPVTTKLVYVTIEFASVGKISIATKYFYVMTNLTKARRNYIVIEIICVAIELAGTESSITHDSARRAQVSRARLARSAHDRSPARAIGTQ